MCISLKRNSNNSTRMPILSTEDEKRKHCVHLFNVPINPTQNKQLGNWFLFVFRTFLGAERQRHESSEDSVLPIEMERRHRVEKEALRGLSEQTEEGRGGLLPQTYSMLMSELVIGKGGDNRKGTMAQGARWQRDPIFP